jgi:hypothetical protein
MLRMKPRVSACRDFWLRIGAGSAWHKGRRSEACPTDRSMQKEKQGNRGCRQRMGCQGRSEGVVQYQTYIAVLDLGEKGY